MRTFSRAGAAWLLGTLGVACTPSALNEGADGVGNPSRPSAAPQPMTPVFDPSFDPFGPSSEPVASYTCPMHPEIVRGEPGTCPICGMKLVLKAPKRGAH